MAQDAHAQVALDVLGDLVEEQVRPLLNDLQQDLLLLLGRQQGLASAVGERRLVATFFTVLLPDAPHARLAGAELLGDVGRLQSTLIQRDDLASLAFGERLHAKLLGSCWRGAYVNRGAGATGKCTSL